MQIADAQGSRRRLVHMTLNTNAFWEQLQPLLPHGRDMSLLLALGAAGFPEEDHG